jgi:glycosyltransferase involved in cell wall biosynthesis
MTQPPASSRYSCRENSVKLLRDSDGERQKPFAFHVVLFTWYEEDIIEACVKNLLAEGVERIFLIDNGSPDATVELAVRAGALHTQTVHSDRFTESVKCGAVFSLVRNVLEKEGRERIWWLFCDADELPTAPEADTIYEHIAQLDDRIRVVGGHFIAHYPIDAPHNCPGFHPADFQFRATPHHDDAVYCDLIHDKHNLIRFDGACFDMRIHGGYHRLTRETPLYEDRRALCIHHFQYRNRKHTLNRLKALVEPDENGCSRLGDAEYNQKVRAGTPVHMAWYVERKAKAEKIYARRALFGDPPRAWPRVMERLNGTRHMFNRWYSEDRLFAAVRERVDGEGFEIWLLNWLMMYKEPERFLRVLT